MTPGASGCGYPQMFVNQTPVYDNAVRKGKRRKKKKANHGGPKPK